MTAALSPDLFDAWFEALHGMRPFPWQARLARRLCEGEGWPALLDLPTGSGKTACIDIAVFHLAFEAARGGGRRAPARIAFLVDRRLVVDDAHARAAKIAKVLAEAPPGPIGEVAEALKGLSGEEPPLLVRLLRGGVPRDRDLVRSPVQPAVFCSTVDQVGSRLLFRGYGVSDRMKPIAAGLLGGDTLILLDEVHLAEPLRQTLEGVSILREPPERRGLVAGPPAVPFIVAPLSATPGDVGTDRFGLSDDDRAHSVLQARFEAGKPTRLTELGKDRAAALAGEAMTIFRDLADKGVEKPVVAVVANRVARARAVFDALRNLTPDAELLLLIGPSRPYERRRIEAALSALKTGARNPAKPTIIVATQTIEAGVDLDLDGLVTEIASLDALRQRFGRLNRGGRDVPAQGVVAAHKEDLKAKDDPVYGGAMKATWDLLTEWAADEKRLDFSISAMAARLETIPEGVRAAVVSPRTDAPVLMPSHVGLWSQTWPIPQADPDVALFLHGGRASPEGVRIVWRADVALNTDAEVDRAFELLAAAPPRSEETLEISLAAARAWLNRDYRAADVSDASETESGDADPRQAGRRCLRWAGAGSPMNKATDARKLRPGDTIVVPSDYGGADEHGWAPGERRPVRDIGGLVPETGRRFVRFTQGLAAAEAERKAWIDNPAITDREVALVRADAAATHRALMVSLADLTTSQAKTMMAGEGEDLRTFSVERQVSPWVDGAPVAVVVSRLVGAADAQADEAPATEDDALGSGDGAGTGLDYHLEQVAEKAAAFSARALVSDAVAADIVLAARLHDAGKADPRFQAMLAGGSIYDVDPDRPLAKSREASGHGAAERAGLPKGWRHEALSVAMARVHPLLREAHDKELVLWLIGVHHGYGRPFFGFIDPAPGRGDDLTPVLGQALTAPMEAGPERLSFDLDGLDWPALFDRLKRRYGVWELARFEAIVRIADHRASEDARRAKRERP